MIKILLGGGQCFQVVRLIFREKFGKNFFEPKNYLTLFRGVRGHAPPENFENLTSQVG